MFDRLEYCVLYALHLSLAAGIIAGSYGALIVFVSYGARF